MPWDPGHVETPELPWLGHEASFEELERREAEAAVVAPLAPASPRAEERGTSRRS